MLRGARVALLESRLGSELAELVRREGGEPVCAPAVCEAPLDLTPQIPALIGALRDRRCALVVFLTGAGASSLFAQAERIGMLAELTAAMHDATTVCRGPKPSSVLRRLGVPIRLLVRAPHTTADLLAALSTLSLDGLEVAVVQDGGGNPVLTHALRDRGVTVVEMRAYEWRLPSDTSALEQLVQAIIAGEVEAVAFTTQIQARHLLHVATTMDRRAALLDAFRHRTIVGSIGPACSAILDELGVARHVVATPPRMRPLVAAIGQALAARAPTPATTRS